MTSGHSGANDFNDFPMLHRSKGKSGFGTTRYFVQSKIFQFALV